LPVVELFCSHRETSQSECLRHFEHFMINIKAQLRLPVARMLPTSDASQGEPSYTIHSISLNGATLPAGQAFISFSYHLPPAEVSFSCRYTPVPQAVRPSGSPLESALIQRKGWPRVIPCRRLSIRRNLLEKPWGGGRGSPIPSRL
jgi:hypothetical protein